MSRALVYYERKNKREDRKLEEEIIQIFKESRNNYGSPIQYNYYGCKGKKQHKCTKLPIHKDFIEDLNH